MNEEVRSLIESIRRGQYEDPSEKIALLAAALQEQGADPALLASLLRAPQVPLRLAALEACRQRPTPEVSGDLLKLSEDGDSRVRRKLAEVLATLPEEAAAERLQTLARDTDESVRFEALKTTTGRPAFAAIQQELLLGDPSWAVRQMAASALGPQADPACVAALLQALAQDDDLDVRQRCADLLEKRLTQQRDATVRRLPTEIGLLSRAERAAVQCGGRWPRLLEWLRSHTTLAVNPQELARFGTDLTALAATGALPHAYKVDQPLRMLLEMLHRDKVRSIALIGPSGSGKSSLVHELVHALARPEHGCWRVLRVSPTDFMAGTKYLGEWETKVRELVAAVRRPRRVLLYVPNLADLASMGRWEKSDANVASALAPYMEDGSILLLGESTPEEFERGLGGHLALQRLFDKVLVEESTREDTREVLRGIRDEGQAPVNDQVLEELIEVSEYFLSHLARPGGAAALLRAVIAARQPGGPPATRRDVLNLLSKSTGIPPDLLDDGAPLELGRVRAFFEERIIGQPEAVEAVVDVVTLIKAGLTDPHKPFSVLFFIGPTGVGKTELARALAEFIFGDAVRLQRFDMSEFASPEGFTRLIGGRGENGLLTDAVHQRPFSVVLFDEIEKAHLNVFDLCLQIFDAGRLTDGRGRLVDFRRTIVILTSNIGAEAPVAGLGFGASTQATTPPVDKDRTARELWRFFRPEFLNRLDRIVHFRPLSIEVTERIARRELDLVLQRSGVARRDLAVNVDPSVISLLVKEGYSPHFGARPLKRTVERLVLLPLARVIASGRVPSRTVLSLNARADKIEVHMTPPPKGSDTEPRPTKPVVVSGLRQVEALRQRFAELDPRMRPLADRKSELVALTQQPGFYQDSATRDATFDELHKLDQFLSRHERLREAIERLWTRVATAGGAAMEPASLEERVRELTSEVGQVEFITTCRNARDLGDVFLCLTGLKAEGQPLHAVETLARMYLGLAARRGFQAAVIAERHDDRADTAFLQVLGLGACALVAGETGLHEFNRRTHVKNPRSGREETHKDSALVRVEVVPLGAEPDKRFLAVTRASAVAVKPARSRLIEKAVWHVTAFHEPSVRSVEVWCAGTRAAALKAVSHLLHAQVQAMVGDQAPPVAAVIRRYDLGIGSRIKDLRTGRTTSRLAQVFRGQLEMLAPDPAST